MTDVMNKFLFVACGVFGFTALLANGVNGQADAAAGSNAAAYVSAPPADKDVIFIRGEIANAYSNEEYKKAKELALSIPNDSYAQFCLGRIYDEGLGVPQDYEQAAIWYRKAAEQGDAPAQWILGFMYQYGNGVSQNYGQAVKWYYKAAEQGNVYGQYYLGTMYEHGNGVTKNIHEARKWYEKAAAQGDEDAKEALKILDNNKTPEIDVATIRSEMEQAYNKKDYRRTRELALSIQDDAAAQFKLGWMYANGLGMSKDYLQAVNWYSKAAEQEFAEAQFWLGVMYENGYGVTKDFSKALRLYVKAAAHGDENATIALEDRHSKIEQAYDDGDYKTARDLALSISDDAYAQFFLGEMYLKGKGVDRNLDEAVNWYRKAAEQGDAPAQSELGILYYYGVGMQQDYEQAAYWNHKAAEQGDAVAQCNLGHMYEYGEGLDKDYEQAAYWYHNAAEQGEVIAQFNLGRMYYFGNGVAKNYTEAVNWFNNAAEQGERMSQYNLGVMYEHGNGVTKNINEARKWYEKAAAQGDEMAREALKRLQAN